MNFPDILNNRWVQTAGVGVVSCAIGATAGYILGHRKGVKDLRDYVVNETSKPEFWKNPSRPKNEETIVEEVELDEKTEEVLKEELKFQEQRQAVRMSELIIDEETYKVKTDYSNLNREKSASAPDPEEDEDEDEEEEEEDEYDDGAYMDESEDVPIPQPPRRNVFTPQDDSWNYNVEVANRTAEAPYIIHQEEFMLDEVGYTQSTLTYYDGDNILADEQDIPVYQHERITGPLRFGHGSNDRNVVYIRNDKLKAEYEILLYHGYFEREVLGRNADMKEKQLSHGVRKFREE